MTGRAVRAVAAALALASALGAGRAAAADADAAERQYRVARRLAAERSPQAADALRKVVELDPQGPLADDAIVDEALLDPLPRWPDELGRLDPSTLSRARGLLDRVVEGMPGADRVQQALYLRGLLRLEPLAGYDAGAARVDLLNASADPRSTEWSRAARLALAWLAEADGDEGRSRDAYVRVVVDAPGTAAAARAELGLGRLALRASTMDEAAGWLRRAQRDGGASASTEPGERLELAVRRLGGGAGVYPGRGIDVVALGWIRSPSAIAAAPDGGLAVWDRRETGVIRVDAGGRESGRWSLEDVEALAWDPLGRLWAAAGDSLWRLDPDAEPMRVGVQGDLEPVAGLAVDALGRLWLTDRKGESLGVVEPGREVPRLVWQERGVRLGSPGWDGRRLVAVDTRARRVVAVDPSGGLTELVAEGRLQRPGPLAVDATGRIAVADAKTGTIELYDAAGAPLGRVDAEGLGVGRLAALGFDRRGRLAGWNEDTSSWVRVP